MPNWLKGDEGRWEGGKVALSKKRKRVWYLDQKRHGIRYSFKLKSRSLEEAKAQLALFDEDPEGYKARHLAAKNPQRAAAPKPPPGDKRLLLNAKLISELVASMEKAGDHPRHIDDTERYLKAWMVALVDRDLRTLALTDLKASLKGWKTAERNRISALKTLTAYLREEGLLKRDQDATLDLKLKKPRAKAASVREEKSIPLENVQKAYAAITARPVGGGDIERMRAAVVALEAGQKAQDVAKRFKAGVSTLWYWRKRLQEGSVPMTDAQSVRDVVLIRIKTGMHHSEIERIAAGHHVLRELEQGSEIAAVVTVLHKSGHAHHQSVDAQTLAAIKRLVAVGRAPTKEHVAEVLGDASEAVGLPRMKPGALRSSFITAARSFGRVVKLVNEGGVPLHEISVLSGHRSLATTRDHYDETKVQPMIVLPLTLQHPDDPAVPVAAAPGRPAPGQGPSSAVAGAAAGSGWLGSVPPMPS
jgi:transposase-like protein